MHIVLIEDNVILSKSIDTVLKHEGYTVTCNSNGEKGCAWLLSNADSYDFVILDVLLPEMNGYDIARSLRNHNITTPILMLTSKGTLGDTIEGLDSGADDYLKKPFEFDELLARIRSLLRRQPNVIESQFAITPDVTIDSLSRKVYKQENEVHLTAKEYGVLTYFLHNPNKVITQQELYDHVFDFAEIQMSNTIEVHIKNIRKKLRTQKYELPLVTLRNAGYRLDHDKRL